MKIVGDQLATWALAQAEDDKKDLFGRSAFNRYYYAAFLSTRQMLGEFEPKWQRTAHRNIPDLLKGALKRKAEQALKSAIDKDILTKGEGMQIIEQHNKSVSDLADLLEQAYQVRISADYEPEVRIQQTNKVISLGGHTLKSAEKWPGLADLNCETIRAAWREAGLAE